MNSVADGISCLLGKFNLLKLFYFLESQNNFPVKGSKHISQKIISMLELFTRIFSYFRLRNHNLSVS